VLGYAEVVGIDLSTVEKSAGTDEIVAALRPWSAEGVWMNRRSHPRTSPASDAAARQSARPPRRAAQRVLRQLARSSPAAK